MIAALQMLVGLGVPATMFVFLSWFRLTARLQLLEVVRAAADAQQPMSAQAIAALSGVPLAPRPQRDRRRGVMLAAIGAALWLFGLLAWIGLAAENMGGAVATGVIIAALGVIPACLGAGYLQLSRSAKDDGED